jgi:hypothetical protein
MKVPPVTVPIKQPNDSAEKELSFQDNEIPAWEPVAEDLWIPYRIRGSWRGGVLG